MPNTARSNAAVQTNRETVASGEVAVRQVKADPRSLALLRYWECMPRGNGLPRRADIDPCAIVGLLPHVWLMDVTNADGGYRFGYRLLGTAVQNLFPEIRHGRSLGDVYGDVAGSLSERQFMAAVTTTEPQWRRGPVLFGPHKSHRRVERLVLPLASDGASVDGFLALTVRLSADDQAMADLPDPYVLGAPGLPVAPLSDGQPPRPSHPTRHPGPSRSPT